MTGREEPEGHPGRRRSPKRRRPRVDAAVFRRVREGYGLTPAEAARFLRIGRSTYYKCERPGGGGPPGLLLALAGLGVMRFGRGVAEIAALMGVDPDADVARGPDGRLLPIIPSPDPEPPAPARSHPPRSSGEGP